MPDINLTRDTKDPSSEKKKKRERDFVYTDPEREKKRKDERKAPSAIRVWLKSLFRRTPKGQQEKQEAPKASVPKKPQRKPDEGVEDIFANASAADVNVQQKKTEHQKEKPEKPEKPAKLKKLPEQEKEESEKRKKLREASGVNLLPEEFSTKVDFRGRGALLGVAIAGTLLFIGLTYAGLVLYEKSIASRTRVAQDTRKAIEAETDALSVEQQQSREFEERLKLVSALLDQHVYWTKFFALLEKYTIDDVYFDGGIRLSSPGSFTLSATGRDYRSVARQLLAFRKAVERGEFISSVTVSGAKQQQDENGVMKTTFTVELELLPNVRTYTAEEFEEVNRPPLTGSGSGPEQESKLPPL